MSLLDGGIRDYFGQVLSGFYLPAILVRYTKTPNGKGGFTTSTANGNIQVQKDNADKTMRETPGFVETDVKFIILQRNAGAAPTTDDRITFQGLTWLVFRVRRDAADSHWVVHAKKG